MRNPVDVLCALALVAIVVTVLLSFTIRRALRPRRDEVCADPFGVALLHFALDPVVDGLVRAGVSANAVTAASLVLGASAGVLLAFGRFGVASLVMLAAALGDAVDGLVARRTRTSSARGALFDASVDRYEELFVVGGTAYFFRSSASMFVLALFALGGSFMVSYGSAKAEAFKVPVPRGAMRRPARAVCLEAGTALTPLVAALAGKLALPSFVAVAPIAAGLALVAVVANVSAIRRLRVVAEAATTPFSRSADSAPSEQRRSAEKALFELLDVTKPLDVRHRA